MARQRIHNRRAGHGGGIGGASWISYSDMMAALLLVFVLILCVSLYQYFQMMAVKTKELEDQQAIVASQKIELDAKTAALLLQQTQLDEQSAALSSLQITLDEQVATLAAQQTLLDEQTAALETANASLAEREAQLAVLQARVKAQQEALEAQTGRIDDLVGVRSRIIRELSGALSGANLRAKVDETNGDIVLDSTVFFESGSNEIKPEGKQLLDAFVPVYLGVLLQPEYRD